nr:hypothetical protein [Bacteroidota bacterium]
MRAILLSLLMLPFLLTAQQHSASGQHAEDRERYDAYFEQAGNEFGVPADLLRGLSFAETRWTHMTWPDDETNSA